MAAQEARHALIEIKTQEDPTAPAQHHHEGHQGTFGFTDGEFPEMAPLCRHPDYAESFPNVQLEHDVGAVLIGIALLLPNRLSREESEDEPSGRTIVGLVT